MMLLRDVRYARSTIWCSCLLLSWVAVVASPRPENRLLTYVHRCSMLPTETLQLWRRSTGSACTPWSRRLFTGNVETCARGCTRNHLLFTPWCHPCMIVSVLSGLLCCVVRDQAVRYFMRAYGRFFWVCLTNDGHHSSLGETYTNPQAYSLPNLVLYFWYAGSFLSATVATAAKRSDDDHPARSTPWDKFLRRARQGKRAGCLSWNAIS